MDNLVRRIGVLAPPGNVAMERELPDFLPHGVVINHNRLSRPGSRLTEGSLLQMAESADRAAHDLAQAYPEVIIYGCTSGSFLGTAGSAERIAERIATVTGVAAFTTTAAVTAALRSLEVRRVFLVTPYPDDINSSEIAFLRSNDIDVPAWDSFRCGTSEDIRKIASSDVAKMVMSHRSEITKCEGVFISCTNLLVMDQITDLEWRLKKPVVTSNQASLWEALRRLGIDTRAVSAGRLFRMYEEAKMS